MPRAHAPLPVIQHYPQWLVTSHGACSDRHDALSLRTAINKLSPNACNGCNADRHRPTHPTPQPLSDGLGAAVLDGPTKLADPTHNTAQSLAWTIKQTGYIDERKIKTHFDA